MSPSLQTNLLPLLEGRSAFSAGTETITRTLLSGFTTCAMSVPEISCPDLMVISPQNFGASVEVSDDSISTTTYTCPRT